MKILFFLIAFSVSAGLLWGEEGYPDFHDPLQGLVYGGDTDVSPESEKDGMERERTIAEFPGAKERLFQFFERDYKVSKILEFVPKSMKAIALRRDLTQDDLRGIDREMALVVARSPRSSLEHFFLIGGISIFEAHPNPEREQLVLRLAYDQDTTVAQAALGALVKMGSEHAGKALDDAIKRTVIPGKDQSLDWMLEEMRVLKRKIDYPSGKREKKERTGEANSPVSVNKPEKTEPLAGSGSGQYGLSKPTMALGLIATAVALLWWLLKKRK
jgi:hypothetical protein